MGSIGQVQKPVLFDHKPISGWKTMYIPDLHSRKTKNSLTGWCDNTITESGNGFHLIVFVVFD
jgi:hypothetical protein